MGTALLLEYYNELPQRDEDDAPTVGVARYRRALDGFKEKVTGRYNEGTLQRLVRGGCSRTRRAAVLALGMAGTMASNRLLAESLHDEDSVVRQRSAEALWSVWLRADSEEHNNELQRLMRLKDARKALDGLDALVQKSPRFAEVYNQRAIVYFRLKDYHKSIADCEKVLRLNPHHFGAQAGMAQCYMKLRKPKPALRAFRNAHRINPGLQGIEETIRALEDVLGEEGRKDDKK